jgi:hypothetical protein
VKKRSKFKAFECPCGGQVKLYKNTGYAVVYPDGSSFVVSDSLALPQCGSCREVFLTPRFEKKVEQDFDRT